MTRHHSIADVCFRYTRMVQHQESFFITQQKHKDRPLDKHSISFTLAWFCIMFVLRVCVTQSHAGCICYFKDAIRFPLKEHFDVMSFILLFFFFCLPVHPSRYKLSTTLLLLPPPLFQVTPFTPLSVPRLKA
ncbi:hypothetical protein BDF20DRAFT_857560 [Mycotypha africana]|uniref:uncharacterized protein n=1 Tax=Mycotypha africana TaxID=64632 RepID=UPI00230082EF|nr:uncharacterized protein BDF20DRAFT_857560 [Mycotypha africana]KAI8984013.1 hypothetical protein BDF20DRAFT_857560 [Mycotypha africana]